MTVRERLAKGDFNYMSQEHQPDGSVIVTMTKRGDNHIYIMHVWHLYQADEEVLIEQVLEAKAG